METFTSKCVVCHRITPRMIFDAGHKIFGTPYDTMYIHLKPALDKKGIHDICVEAMTIIAFADKTRRQIFCGKSARCLLAGLFYRLTLEHGLYSVTQLHICKKLGVTVPAIRGRYRMWGKEFPLFFPKTSASINPEKKGWWKQLLEPRKKDRQARHRESSYQSGWEKYDANHKGF